MFLGQYFSSIFIVVFTFSDDFEDEDVQLKYEKRGGEIWVSLDQYKLSSPSPEKLFQSNNPNIINKNNFKS